jgi:yeast amino acid transporter
MVTINVSPDDSTLFGAEGTNASPFVVAYRNASIPALAHMMNAIILLSVISCGSISCYAGARTTMGLAFLNMGPKQLKWADKTGRPWFGMIPTLVIGLGLAFINVSNEGRVVFGWFSNLTSLFTLFGWGTSE